MTHDDVPAYGLWSSMNPQTTRDWRSIGAFSAFLVALFEEGRQLQDFQVMGQQHLRRRGSHGAIRDSRAA
jgi:hypothetical protein